MNLKQLRTFVAVARNGSLTRASLELSVTQPAISRQLAHLEEEIGAALLARHPRGVALTAAGELLMARSEQILRALSELRSDVSDLGADLSGELRIGYPPALARALIDAPLQAFLRRHPHVRVQLQERFSDELRDMTLAGEVDFAVVSSRSREPNLKSQPLFKEEIWLFGPKTRARSGPSVAPASLATLPMLLPRRANTIRAQVERYVASAGRLNIVVESSSNTMIQDLMRAGCGYTAAPFSAHEDLLRRRQIWGERIPGLRVERFLIQRADHAPTRAVADFLKRLRDQSATFKPSRS